MIVWLKPPSFAALAGSASISAHEDVFGGRSEFGHLGLTLAATLGFVEIMGQTCRDWIRLIILAAFVFGSGFGGVLAHGSHEGHAGNGHEPGLVASATASVSHANGCDQPAHTGGHCAEVHCCAAAVHLGSGRPNVAPLAGNKYMNPDHSLHFGQLSYPLLRPPIATA